ncbi:MAG: saccharopine dehydrogenase NADP-binding domain-containing protein [Deltaproteobacteria bacterium]|nr:saccharopine dehydrogenase NADP-binding domain-containing protein [Deltaproteobacteria bacterium]MDP2657992.1 saccharopine dehydrogenase NADP-binding domain-containing protein [Candidatus Deferrimicrobium sp.]
MKIVLLGAAGFTGRAAAVLLARRDDVGELILVDYDIRDAKRLAKALSPKCRWAMADVGKPLELSRLLEGIDAVASAVGPGSEYEKAVLLSCAAGGIATATIGEGTIAAEDRREIDRVFRDANVPAVVGCGMMPGWTELLAEHFLNTGDATANPPLPFPAARYLFFSPARFGGYAFLRGVAKGITGASPSPAGAPAGNYFALPDGSRIGVPEGKAGTRLGWIVGTAAKLGAVGKEFSAALLLWTRGGMPEPAGTPVAVAGVAAGDRFARVEDPKGNLGAALLAETAVRLAARPHKATGLLPLPELIGREEAEAIAAAAGARIVSA